jgi:hypothetical protein
MPNGFVTPVVVGIGAVRVAEYAPEPVAYPGFDRMDWAYEPEFSAPMLLAPGGLGYPAPAWPVEMLAPTGAPWA